MRAESFWLDYFLAQSFVSFESSRRQRAYAGLCSFFLLTNARSKLRR